MSHMGIDEGHQTAEEYREEFAAQCPEKIYLLNQPECICWCDDPDPAGMGPEDAPWSMAYVRWDIANERRMEHWRNPAYREPERGQVCLFLVPTSVRCVIVGYIQEAEDDKAFSVCDIRDQYGEPVGYEGEDVELWMPLVVPDTKDQLPEVL